MTLSFSPLSLSEVHRRRAMRVAAWGADLPQERTKVVVDLRERADETEAR